MHKLRTLAAGIAAFASKARHGYVCSNKTAIAAIAAYGFLPTSTCGSGS